MLQKNFQVRGMHCASCEFNISKKLKALFGVESCTVNYATEKATISYDPGKISIDAMNEELGKLGYSIMNMEDRSKHAMSGDHSEHTGGGQTKEYKLKELDTMKEKVDFALPVTFLVFALMLWDIAAQVIPSVPNLPIPMPLFNTITFVLAAISLFWIGKPFVDGVIKFIFYRTANMDTLVGIGTLTAFIYSSLILLLPPLKNLLNVPDYTYFDVTIVVIGFVTLGKYLEAKSKLKTGDAIEKLLNLQAKTAFVIREGVELEVPVSDVASGDSIIVKPASRIPVDGILLDGSSFVDEAMITGEPMPVKKEKSDTVVAGTLNTSGTFTFRATKVGSETLLSHIITMVEDAQGSKAPIQALADKISAVFVPTVIILSFLTLGVWLSVGTHYLGFSQALSYGLVSFVGILVIACPCALGLATPTAIIVGVGKGAREGILIKDAATLEKLHKVTTIVVDKTGTITRGKPELISIEPQAGITDKEIISILASLEARSEHPIAHAIISYAKEHGISNSIVEQFEMIKGKGVKGTIGGIEYLAGNTRLVNDIGISLDTHTFDQETKTGKTPIILATNKKILGTVMIADALKPEAKEAVDRLHKLGIKVIMLTGDNKNTARYIADQVGIDEVIAEVLPEDKLLKIKELQAQGEVVAMAGDGVNDAPALAQADVGVAMSTGTDVAIETSGITLLNGDVSKLVKAIKLSKLTMRGIRQNLFWAFFYNVVGIPLAAGAFYPIFGWLLNPVFAGLAMALSSVSVVSNSLRLKAKNL